MDSYDGPAALEWRFNDGLCAAAEVDLHVTSTGGTLKAWATLVDSAEAEGMDFLIELDPMFDLRVGEDRTLTVRVARDQAGRLTMTEWSE